MVRANTYMAFPSSYCQLSYPNWAHDYPNSRARTRFRSTKWRNPFRATIPIYASLVLGMAHPLSICVYHKRIHANVETIENIREI